MTTPGITAEGIIGGLLAHGHLAACPECQCDDQITIEANESKRLGRVKCERCELATGQHRKLERAVADWNRNRALRHIGKARAADGAAAGSFAARQRAREMERAS